MSLAGISWVAVIVAVVANMILGFLWFGPLFGKQWMKAVGKSESELDQSATMYVVPVVASLVVAIVLWNVMQATGLSGILAAFWMWLGFTALTSLTNAVFRDTGLNLWLFESGNHLVGFVLTGLILNLL